MVNAQLYIEKNYPDKENTKKIYVRNWESYPQGEGLTGHLDLRNYKNLEELDLFANNITSLNLLGLKRLWSIWIGCNQLKELDLTDQRESLTHFHIGDNDFPEQDLSVFSDLINLQDLRVGGWERNLSSEEIFNKFNGSLRPLRNLSKLKTLHIENTNIDSGLEYLPENINHFGYGDVASAVRSETGGSNKFSGYLVPYNNDIKAWREDNKELIKKARREIDDEIDLDIKKEKLTEIQLPLKEIPSEYWDKIEVGNDWDREYQVDASVAIPIMTNHAGGNQWDKKFKSQEVLNKFKSYTNPEDKFFGRQGHPEETNNPPWKIKDIDANTFYFVHTPSKMSDLIRGGGKVFKEGNKLKSKEAFEFLQSIIESKEIKATIKLTNETNTKENEELKNQIKQLLELKETDELPTNWNELLVKRSDLEKLTEKETKINELLTQVKTLQEKVKEEKIPPLSQTQEELNSKEKKFNELESEIRELRKKEDELEDEVSDLKKQIRKANNAQEKKALEEKLEDANKELERTQDKLKVSEEARGKLRNEMNTLRDKLKELQTEKGNELDRLSYENNQLALNLNVAKEKIRELENSERNSEQIKELQEKNNSLAKQLEETKSELSFLKITNSLNESKDKEVGEMASELSDSNKKLEAQKVEKDKLENEITDKEKQKQTLKNEGKIDSEEYRKLLAELEKLRKKLEIVSQEIEKSRKQVANLKEQLSASYQSLQEEIEEKKEQLREAKEECLKKLEENQTWYSKLINANDTNKLVETLLKAQKEITRDSNDNFAPDEKKRIIESIPKELTEELNSLCILQDYLTQLELKKENIEKVGQALKTVLIAPVMPPHLRNKESDIEDRNDIENNVNYNKIFSESKEFILQKNYKTEKLPTRLYNIQENRVVETKNNADISNYAILSYVWGETGDLSEGAKTELDSIWGNIGYQNKLNPSGYKSLKKASQTCKLLGIDYLWMDQLCTNQGDNEDKNKEVPKMRQYYFNSVVTLVSINRSLSDEEITEKGVESEKVLEKVVRSKWFSRSWTYQEGWLSKQTLFMFDNHLIDGSLLASQWVLGQPAYTDNAHYKNILDKDSQKIATPLGWVYYKEGYDEEDRISFTLNQALRAIKNRGRGVSIDGIYSILGLLPYGDKVKVEYKKWGERYEKKDIQKALFNVMITAMKESGYNEYFAWHGAGNDWLPDVYEEDDSGYPRKTKGGTSIEGGISIIGKKFDTWSDSDNEISVSKYIIVKEIGGLKREEKKDKGSVIDSGAYTGNILVISASENSQEEIGIRLLGTSELLEKKIKENDILLLLSKKEWRSNKPFALLVRKKENENFYQRVGLAEMSKEDWEKLQGIGKEEKLIVKVDAEQEQIQVAQVEVPPK